MQENKRACAVPFTVIASYACAPVPIPHGSFSAGLTNPATNTRSACLLSYLLRSEVALSLGVHLVAHHELLHAGRSQQRRIPLRAKRIGENDREK